MCGLFGWNIAPDAPITMAQRETLASSLARANALRGPHSWGAYTVTRGAKGPEIEMIKRVGSIAKEAGIGALGVAETCLGHTRWATTGEVVPENCHPFTVGEYTLAHNGMIHNHREIAKRYGRETTARVDSMHLVMHLAEGRSFTDLEGYGTVTYARAAQPAEIHLSRMSGGELTVYGIGTMDKPHAVVWSSNAGHLRDALKDANVPHFPYEVLKEGRVYVASADGALYILPETIRHDLAVERKSFAEIAASRALTSGHGGSFTVTVTRSGKLTKREKRAQRKAERKARQERQVALADAFAEVDKVNGEATLRDGRVVPIDLAEMEEIETFRDAQADAEAMMDSDAAAWLALRQREGLN